MSRNDQLTSLPDLTLWQSSLSLAVIDENMNRKEREVISFYQELKNYEKNKIDFACRYNIEIKKYQLQDLCGGIKVDVTIGSKFDADRCQVPTEYAFADYTDSNLTLKQIITRLEGLALSHRQINHYFFFSHLNFSKSIIILV